MKRRQFLQLSSAAGIGSLMPAGCSSAQYPYQDGKSPWPLSLNTSTIRPVSLMEKIEAAAKAGYDAIELWINEIEKYEQDGGQAEELGALIKSKGLYVPNVIGLWDCMPMDDEAFSASLNATKNRMRLSAAAGSRHVAAIPVPDREDFDLKTGIKRYKELLKIGREEYGIIVAFEFVGFFKGIHRMGQAAGIALDTDDPDACLIMDSFHLYRGGSGFKGIKHLNGTFIADFHINDVPQEPARETLRDKNRIYPGDGILPLVQLLKDLKDIGYQGPLSLEIFNEEEYKKDPLLVARTGKQKIMDLVAKAEV
jgi:sugar phosphate isomerase/epimerase